MNKVKYQIFISSTYSDLKEERDQVIKACLEMGHIPVGMEMFSAADEEQWQIIKRQIDESDYYVIIVANRYGSIVDGISYTEKEYDYAVSLGVPVLGFVLDQRAFWPMDRSESGEDARRKLDVFKTKVLQKPVNFWLTKEDLHGKCAVALMKTFNTQPRLGWVRASNEAGPEVVQELSRLSSENAKLRAELAVKTDGPDTSDLAQGEDELVIIITISGLTIHENISVSLSWDKIFIMTAKAILYDQKEKSVGDYIAYACARIAFRIKDINEERVNKRYFEKNTVEIIRTQLLALALISIEFKDGQNHWLLTAKGQHLYTSLSAIKKA